jgi:signal transduction histidine kinase
VSEANKSDKPRRRTVATRILVSYLIVLLLFSGASLWSVVAFRQAVSEAALLRQGYLPLALSLRDVVADQDTWNSQLNHVTVAKNPADAQAWFDTALSLGRPKGISKVRAAIERALPPSSSAGGVARSELLSELSRCAGLMESDAELLKKLFATLERGDEAGAQSTRDGLVRHGLRVQKALLALEGRVTVHVDGLVDAAKDRERMALIILLLLGGLTLSVGALMALYARRVLAPLSHVTARADAVAAGDLSAEPAIESGDEIGELSETFEGMVRAIAEAREKLLASERLAAIGKMAAHVTHEVRNPLSSIALNLDLLEEEISTDDQEAKNLLRAIGQEVERLSGLSDQYLSMARRKPPELEETDLGALVRSAIDFMRPEVERHGVDLQSSIPAQLPWVELDQGQVRQVLFNLVRNAREAMPEGGKVLIDVRLGDSELEVRVTDNGPGVPPERIEQLFDPFYTTKDHGTGLGLAVSRQILAAHGGRLDYTPADPHGSVFAIVVPLGRQLESPPHES